MRIKMPAVRIAQADAEASCQDTLTCGACSKTFSLADIVRFIQHKVLSCSAPINNNNNNNSAIANSNNSKDGYHSDSDGGGGGGVVSSRRPSISAPISTRKAVANTSRLQHPPLSPSSASASAAGVSPPLLSPPPPSSTPKRRSPGDDHEDMMLDLDDAVDTKPPRIKLEATDSSPDLDAGAATAVKRCRADVADAESNTTHSEPTNYICCTCKQRVHSAWRLLQHAQTCHGIRLYVTDNTASSPTKVANTSSSSSTSSSCSSSSSNCSSASGNGAGGAGTCLPPPPGASSLHQPLPPTSLAGSRAALHHPSASPLEHHLLGLPSTPPQLGSTSSSSHPFGVGGLLRSLAPGSDRVPPAPTAAPPPPFPAGLFARPSSHHEHHFRMEQLVQEQLRLNPLAAAAAVAAAAASAPGAPHLPPPPTSHNPFAPVPPLPLDRLAGGGQTSSAPGTPRGVDPPQMDFYSQRLRQLAGTTSPGSAVVAPSNSSTGSPSPRKPLLTPPFASPSPVPALNSSGGSNSPHHQQASHNDTSPVLDASVTNNNAPQPPSTPPSKIQQSSDDGSALQNQNRPSSPSVSRACEFCGKKFRFQSNLIVHRRTHTGEKPYKCAVCNHACTQSSKLKRHMKIHRHSSVSAVTRSTGENGELTSSDATPSANNNNNSTNTTPENGSRTGSVEPLDEDGDDEDEDDDEEDDDDEEEEEEEEMELEEEEDDDDDDDLGGDGDAPEDLTTKSTSSTPPNHVVSSTGSDKAGGGGDNNTHRLAPPTPSPLEKIATSGSLVGELMDKFGLSNIQQYSEAYKQALQESVVGTHHHHLLHLKDEFLHHRSPLIMDNNNQSIGKPPSASSLLAKENGLMEKSAAAMRFREEFAKNMMAAGQPPLDLMGAPHGLFGAAAAAAAAAAAFDSANPFDAATKRLKLDLDAHLPHHGSSQRSDRAPSSGSADAGGGNGGLYAGLWLPAMAAAAHHRDHLFGGGDTMDLLANHRSSKDILKASAGGGGKAGPSASTLAAALNLGMPPTSASAVVAQQQQIKKESRRNDTCEFCGKVFKNCSNLTVHRRSHTGEKPYKCELCSYACAQSSKLTRHMKTHGRLGKDVYRCRFCEMPFSVPSTLEKHMRKCVVNQNSKSGGGQHMLVSAGEDTGDSSASATKDAT